MAAMIGARGIGATDPERERGARDFDDDRELEPPPALLERLLSLEVLVKLRVGKENTFVLTFRNVAP